MAMDRTAMGPTDEELISQRIQAGIAAIKARNYDLFNGFISESFSSSTAGDKAALLSLLKVGHGTGQLDGLEVDLSQAKIVVTGKKATISPVTAQGSFGSLNMNVEGEKESGVWVLTGGEQGY